LVAYDALVAIGAQTGPFGQRIVLAVSAAPRIAKFARI
jgi:hypothetical protein